MVDVGAGAIIAGKFLAPHASKIAGKLARRATFRWRLRRRIQRSVDFAFPARGLARWLRTVSDSVLAEPIEIGGPRLVGDLDRWLARTDPAWRERDGHVSLTLQLVEAFYVETLRLEEPEQGRVLAEQWARRRNEDLIAEVLDMSGGLAPASRPDIGVWLRRRSHARREQRISPFGIDLATLSGSMSRIAGVSPRVDPGKVALLVGGFGSGKSEIAEQWHRERIESFVDGFRDALPVWLHARQFEHASLDNLLVESVGVTRLRNNGVALVIDGLDEIEGSLADGIVRDALIHVTADHLSSVLITTRPGTVPPSNNDIEVPLIQQHEADALLDELVGRANVARSWTATLRDSIRSPFFLLSAAAIVIAGDSFSSEAELLSKMATLALERTSSSAAFASREAFELLQKLAIAATEGRSGELDVDARERRVLLATRLVAAVKDGTLSFNLPIFQQWFASQALKQDGATFSRSIASASAFDLWRWAMVIALLEAPTARVDEMLARVLAFNVGAGSWLIKRLEVARRSQPGGPRESDARSAHRLLRSTRAWLSSIGDLASWVLPVHDGDSPVRLGVNIREDTVMVRCSLPLAAVDEVQLVSIEDFRVPGRWVGPTHRLDRTTDLWPWIGIRDLIVARMHVPLESRHPIDPHDAAWNVELRYECARRVAEKTSIFHSPIDANSVTERGNAALANAPTARNYSFGQFKKEVTSTQLRDMLSWLRSTEQAAIVRPLPTPDLDAPISPAIESFYTPEKLVHYCAEVWGNALQIYDELVAARFSSLAWALSRHAVGRVCILGELVASTAPDDGSSTVEYSELPEALWVERVTGDDRYVVSTNGRAAFCLTDKFVGLFSDEREAEWEAIVEWSAGKDIGPFWSLANVGSVIHTSADRPASDLAVTWLVEDLKRVSLGPARRPKRQI